MGKHINQIHTRLEKIESSINEINTSHSDFIRENLSELSNIRETMVSKEEFGDFVEKMKISLGEMLPPLPALIKGTSDQENLHEEIKQ